MVVCIEIRRFNVFYRGSSLCFPVPMFPGPYVPRPYVSRYLCSPVPMFPGPMFPGTYVPRSLCSPALCFPVGPTYVPRYLCSPVPMFPGPMFPSTYVPRSSVNLLNSVLFYSCEKMCIFLVNILFSHYFPLFFPQFLLIGTLSIILNHSLLRPIGLPVAGVGWIGRLRGQSTCIFLESFCIASVCIEQQMSFC